MNRRTIISGGLAGIALFAVLMCGCESDGGGGGGGNLSTGDWKLVANGGPTLLKINKSGDGYDWILHGQYYDVTMHNTEDLFFVAQLNFSGGGHNRFNVHYVSSTRLDGTWEAGGGTIQRDSGRFVATKE